MKAATIRHTHRTVIRPYPNAADRRYHLQRLLDGVLAVATVVGGLTALVVFIFL